MGKRLVAYFSASGVTKGLAEKLAEAIEADIFEIAPVKPYTDIGFPIWYWAAPNIINTFVKQYDLSGKKIVLFATSGGSNIGKTAEKLKPYLSAGAEIAGAEVLNQNPSLEELKQWAVW